MKIKTQPFTFPCREVNFLIDAAHDIPQQGLFFLVNALSKHEFSSPMAICASSPLPEVVGAYKIYANTPARSISRAEADNQKTSTAGRISISWVQALRGWRKALRTAAAMASG